MNSELYGKNFAVPKNILNVISAAITRYPDSEGIRRAKFILKNGSLTYQALKRLKHDMSGMGANDVQYLLAGGEDMKNFVDNALNSARKIEIGALNESDDFQRQENALAVIVNEDNAFLLLKRGDNCWAANKYGLAGGKIEDDETPEQACKRETFEETGVTLDNFIKRLTIERIYDNTVNCEHIFASRYTGDIDKIKLNGEHSAYGWYTIDSMKHLDMVPNLIEYITICFKNYN
jgi:mutator protein MutT